MTESKSFVAALFDGRLEPAGLAPFPRLTSDPKETTALFARIRAGTQSPPGVERLRGLGLLSSSEAMPALALSRVVRELSGVDVSTALSFIAHVALGLRLVDEYGTDSQRAALRRHPGGAVLAFALTEANPGSDVSQLQTYAEPTADGYILSGRKSWVTNAVVATHFIVFARTAPPGASTKPRLTAFLVPRCSGVSVDPLESSVLPGASVGELTLDRVTLRPGDVLGPVGKGFRVVMRGLADARLHVGAAALGASIRAFDETIERLNQRRAFGRKVGHFPSVQDRVATMLSDILALESLVHGAAGASSARPDPDPVERAVVRLAASRTSARVLDTARELQGAAAFSGDSVASRRWADTRALTLLDGSDLALESFIVLDGTRALRQHLEASHSPTLVRSLSDFTGGLLTEASARLGRRAATDDGVLVPELTERALRFAAALRTQLRLYGKEIIEMQHVQRRLAMVLTELSTWHALSMRVRSDRKEHGETGSRRIQEAAEIWAAAASRRIEYELSALLDNDDAKRDRIASRAYGDQAYPFDVA
jgi:acyl-CoA dehydrogenase family protein 9